MTEKIQEEAQSIVDYAMRKGGETMFSDNERYPMEWKVIGDFLTNSWIIRGEYTKEIPPDCIKLMDEPLWARFSEVDAVVRVVQLLKGGSVIV